MNTIYQIYKSLMKKYGPQGWWPTNGKHTKADYSHPKNEKEKFEIILGAILTQNTSWKQVEKALANLEKLNAVDPGKILKLEINKLKKAIKPAGYFNQKAGYMRNIAKFYLSLKGKTPTRREVLAVKGVGDETADCIMLYAYRQLEFVVDAYTRRIFFHLGLIKEKASYYEIKELFQKNLPKDLIVYQEYHALLVEHAKRYYSKNPYGKYNPLGSINKNT